VSIGSPAGLDQAPVVGAQEHRSRLVGDGHATALNVRGVLPVKHGTPTIPGVLRPVPTRMSEVQSRFSTVGADLPSTKTLRRAPLL
jgi:hypothetical protein